MNQNKKNEIIDYGKFFERKKEKEVEGHEKRKRFSFGFKDFWVKTDKKTKIEMIVFLVVVIMTLGILIFYFLGKTEISESSLYPPSQRVDFLPYEK
jgi:flagellar basal body-associated protein FliL